MFQGEDGQSDGARVGGVMCGNLVEGHDDVTGNTNKGVKFGVELYAIRLELGNRHDL